MTEWLLSLLSQISLPVRIILGAVPIGVKGGYSCGHCHGHPPEGIYSGTGGKSLADYPFAVNNALDFSHI